MSSKDQALNQNQPKNFKLKYEDISDTELDTHLKLLKQWLVKYNTFEFDNQSTGKLSALNIEEIQIILNYKTNFARVKLYIDYLELERICPNFAVSFRTNFLKYYKYINFITRKILISSKKIKEDTSVFPDFVILNYPFIYSKVTHRNFLSMLQISNGIIGFSKCYVTQVSPPIFLLWAKKIYKTCQCNTKEFRNKFFNVFTKNIKLNSKFQNSYCKICKKDYSHDKKADIFIECQEIELTLQTDFGLINNCIKVWAFGDLINSVKKGNSISLIAYYIPEVSNCLEKEFEYGYFIAMNFNLNFTSLDFLQANNFLLQQQKKKNDIYNAKDDKVASNEEKSISDLLHSLQFQRQFINDFFKFIMQNWQSNKKRAFENISHQSPYVSNSYQAFISIILDISVTQRDYANYNSKLAFLSSNNANYLIEVDNSINSHSNIIENSAITNSYNVVFKSKIFDVNNKNIKGKDIQYPTKSTSLNEDTFKKYFRLSKSISSIETKGDMLLKPFNLFLVFDDMQLDPLYCQLKRYATESHKDIIVLFPNFTNSRFDKQIFLRFLYQCNNKILLIQNIDLLKKQETEFIGAIMSENSSCCPTEFNDDTTYNISNSNSISSCVKGDQYGLNITFWFCCSANRLTQTNTAKPNKASNGMNMNSSTIGASSFQELKLKYFDMIISKCEGVFNCSKRRIKSKGIDIINEHTFTSFFDDINQSQLNSDRLLKQYSVYDMISKLTLACDTQHYFDLSKEANSIKAAKLLEDYFISKRDITRINFDDLFTLLRIAVLTSMIRAHYDNRKIILPSTILNMNLFDSIFAIILYEEFTGHKYGNEAQSFSDVTDKILFYDYNTVCNNFKSMILNDTNSKILMNELSHPIIPKTKTKTSKIVEMKEDCKSSSIFNLMNDDPKKGNDINCMICNAISKVDYSKEVYFNFIEKLDAFIYKERELI